MQLIAFASFAALAFSTQSLQSQISPPAWQDLTLVYEAEIVAPPVMPGRVSLSNAKGGVDVDEIRNYIRSGDADGVAEAGGTPLEAVAAMMRNLHGNRKLIRLLRQFANTSDGSRLSFGKVLDDGMLLRTAPDGTVQRISLDRPARDLLDDDGDGDEKDEIIILSH